MLTFHIILSILYKLLSVYEIIILLRCVLSFVFAGRYNAFYMFLIKITDPILLPIRNILARTPIGSGMFDFSPVVAILLIGVIERCLVLISRIF